MGYRTTNQIFITSAPVEVGPGAPGLGTAALGAFGRATVKKVATQGGRAAVGLVARTERKVAVQTGRLAVGLAGFPVSSLPGPAGSFTHVTVTRDYDLATGAAPAGTVTFTPSAWLVNNGVTVVAAPVVATLDVDGVIAIDLVANTDPGTAPAGSHYTVREDIRGQLRRTYRVVIPHGAGSPIELSGLPVLS